MSKKQKKSLICIAAAAGLYACALILDKTGVLGKTGFSYAALIAYLIPYFIAGGSIWLEAFEKIKSRNFLDENLLMIIASVGAFAVREYSEAVAVILFYRLGELFESIAVGRSRSSVAALTDICPEYANLKCADGITQVEPDEVGIGDVIVIMPGERIPVDCKVTDGISNINTAPVTGESIPRCAEPGTALLSGCINGEGLLTAEVTAEFYDSTVSRILELVENANEKKAPTEKFITKFARYYTPAVVLCALALALIPTGFTGDLSARIQRACTFLVVSCPCALVISIPMSFFGGIGAASSNGILFKGGSCIEKLAKLKTVLFDKTGTLTKGSFTVSEIHSESGDENGLLSLAAAVEAFSSHPIARSIVSACKEKSQDYAVTDIKEIPGRGISAAVNGKRVLVGSNAFVGAEVSVPIISSGETFGTTVHVAADGRYLGRIVISDQIKQSAAPALDELKNAHIGTVMLTGDAEETALYTSRKLNIGKVFYELLPDGKVHKAEEIITETKNGTVAFAGDGINDAPVLTLADIGIAMGAVGSDAAIEAADIVLVEDDLTKIPAAVRIARKTMRTVRTNIIFSLVVKFAVLVLGAAGLANMWAAVFADVGVAVIAILNAMRILKAH